MIGLQKYWFDLPDLSGLVNKEKTTIGFAHKPLGLLKTCDETQSQNRERSDRVLPRDH